MRTRTVSAKAVTIGLSLAWPFAVWGLSGILGPWPLLLTGCALVAWRLPQARGLAAIAALTLLALGLTVDAELGVRGYPSPSMQCCWPPLPSACGAACLW